MLSFLKRKKNESAAVDATEEKSISLFHRFKEGLSRTRSQLSNGLANLLHGKKVIDAALIEAIETQLLTADVGASATKLIIQDLTEKVARHDLHDVNALFAALKQQMTDLLLPCQIPFTIPKQENPYVILMVGINGSGKTTTIGKLAKRLQADGYQVMLAAGDTFRAAAIEQLKVWGERHALPVISQHIGADSASVIYDALQAAKARNIDVLIADTAGRLHTQHNLMDELRKVKRVMAKLDSGAPHQVLLVLDAGIGQNTLRQAEEFMAAVGVTGLCLTKLDGTAKGGVIFALAKQIKIPIYFIGVGEGVEDLQPFDAKEFVEALFEG
jgi:fused signal recognition particle receptor